MDTSKLKRFAIEARNRIKQGVVNKLTALGFDGNGEAQEFPRKIQGATLYRGQQYEEDFYDKWIALYEAIRQKGIKEVYEEVAYTWFNRFMAIRILQVNGFIDRVLLFDHENIRVPHIVSEARQGRTPELSAQERLRLLSVIGDPSKTYEQFTILLVAFCHTTPIINKCFGGINDYTELLLPVDVLDKGGFIDMLNHTDFISEEDYRTTEMLGWLYQFYISERKDDVFASFKKGKKAEADDIAPATQIFTPNWIVKYMVQNTIGRIYLDNNPGAKLESKMHYLVPKADDADEHIYEYSSLEDLKVIDPACGSGHILLEAFDLLYDMYQSDYYSRDEAVRAIFEHNLYGIDLDTRAKQLATFALLLKACQKDASFLSAKVMPKVIDMPRPHELGKGDLHQACLDFIGGYEDVVADELAACIEDMKDIDTLGSIMQFELDDMRPMIATYYEDWVKDGLDDCPKNVRLILPYIQLILALTDKYTCVIANPPYMGAGNMNSILSKYVKEHYLEGKADLFSVFMMMGMEHLQDNGKMAQINMQSWMFLSSFEKLRNIFLHNYIIDNMLHLGPRTFDELSGEVVQNTAFVMTLPADPYGGITLSEAKALSEAELEEIKRKFLDDTDKDADEWLLGNPKGTYYRLVDGKDCADKEQMFLSNRVDNENNLHICYQNVEQKNFGKIPGSPLGYWVSENFFSGFAGNLALSAVAKPCVGLQTADNARFLRYWFEVSHDRIGFGCESSEMAKKSMKKWFPTTKGGTFRRWFGNMYYVVNWENDGEELTNFKGSVIRNRWRYFTKCGSTWSTIASGKPSFRYFDRSWLFETKGSVCFPDDEKYNNMILGFLNSPLATAFLQTLAPTLDFHEGPMGRIPYKSVYNVDISNLVQQNISLSKQDWDAHETSWDFSENPLVAIAKQAQEGKVIGLGTVNHIVSDAKHDTYEAEVTCLQSSLSMADIMEAYKQEWTDKFMQLHANEEELNRQFIDIYGLQDELTPDVPLDEITILQQGEISVNADGKEEQIEWHDDVIIKQFISYAIGCMMGRYRLDKSGLAIAHPNPTADELASYSYHGKEFEIDDDAIIPLMSEYSPFNDNASVRLNEFVKMVFGEDTFTENLNYMEACLGNSLSAYLQKDFWKDHKKMYSNRPIYWLFSSKKGAFRAIAYMHRMDAYTVGKIRTKYLLKHVEYLKQNIENMMVRQAELTANERKKLASFNKDLEECREYDIALHEVANRQITFDLDDGVIANYAKYGTILAKLK